MLVSPSIAVVPELTWRHESSSVSLLESVTFYSFAHIKLGSISLVTCGGWENVELECSYVERKRMIVHLRPIAHCFLFVKESLDGNRSYSRSAKFYYFSYILPIMVNEYESPCEKPSRSLPTDPYGINPDEE